MRLTVTFCDGEAAGTEEELVEEAINGTSPALGASEERGKVP